MGAEGHRERNTARGGGSQILDVGTIQANPGCLPECSACQSDFGTRIAWVILILTTGTA